MVFQNAEDIARESDRQRSRKSHQRNSWSNDLRRSVRSSVTDRPLSTGHLYVSFFFIHRNYLVYDDFKSLTLIRLPLQLGRKLMGRKGEEIV